MGLFDFLNKNSSSQKASYDDLKESFSKKHKEAEDVLVEKHKDALSVIANYPTQLVAGAFGGLILLTNSLSAVTPQNALTIVPQEQSHENGNIKLDPSVFLISDLGKVLPDVVQPLTPEQEKEISQVLARNFNMKVSAELQGIRLNRSYGLIGAEQHLARYPGDTMATHFSSNEDAEKYYSSGMAPGLGAWGYFTKSSHDLSLKDVEKEKYYIATQTFLAPGFHDDVYKYITFFKHRKMLVVNPQNGKAMVVVIGDAGPGASTGKHLGGSPEVMKYLERVDGKQKGPVLYFFIDDPEDTIPLGPIQPKKS